MTAYMNQTESNPEYTVIIDVGQASTKVGFAGDEKPRAIFPTVVGKPKYQTMTGITTKNVYVGDDTTRMRGVLKLDYPIDRGNVMDWDSYFEILNHIFYDVLRVTPKNCNVIYLVPPLTPPDISQYFARVLFETHHCKKVAIVDTASTGVFAVGETTGLSVEMGCGITTITPVMDGQVYTPSIRRLNLAGVDIEEHLNKLLTQYGMFQKREIVKDIKEKAIKIARVPEQAIQDPSNSARYVLPDGEPLDLQQYITIMAAEILFSPGLITQGVQSVPEAILSSLKNVNPGFWRPLLKRIILSGGTSTIKGLEFRLEQEILNILPQLGPIPADATILAHEADRNAGFSPPPPPSGGAFEVKMENCSKCGESVNLHLHKACPNCGTLLHMQQINILDSDDKLSRKEKKVLKATSADQKELANILGEVEDEYGTEEELEELTKIDEKVIKKAAEGDVIVDVILGKNRLYGAFQGAAILGSLPQFVNKMLTHEQFQVNPAKIVIDFSSFLNTTDDY